MRAGLHGPCGNNVEVIVQPEVEQLVRKFQILQQIRTEPQFNETEMQKIDNILA